MPALQEPFDPSSVPFVASFDSLPDYPIFRHLKSRRQWVSWKYEAKIDKDGNEGWTKPPVSPNSPFKASTSNRATWGTYDQAVAKSIKFGLAGVGYVLTADDNFSGADLDGCRNSETGELDEWAAEIVALNETYVEVSPSGEGLRFFWEGKIDAAIVFKPASVEIYATGRYLTITGHHIESTPTKIQPAPKTEALLRARVAEFRGKTNSAPAEATNMAHSALPEPSDHASPFFRNVNSAALASISSWVDSLFSGAKYHPGTKAYRISSRQLGRDLQEDLSIAPNGIVDFGVHDLGDARRGKRTPIDLVIEYGGAPDAKAAAFWLCDRLGQKTASLGWEEDDGRGAILAEELLTSRAAIIDAPITSPGAVLDGLQLGQGVDWTRPSGLLGEMASWILASSRRPNRPLAVAASVAVLSAVCGRHLYGPTGTSLNVYIACLAATTVGKSRPLSAVAEVLRAAKLDNLHTTAKGFSVSALEKMIESHPCCVATVDEIGSNLLGRMSHKQANTHELAMRGMLLELWSREQGMTPFSTHHRATSSSVPIPSPSLSLFGVSTPEAFYGAITTGSVKDGFLNRFLIASAAPRARPLEVSEQARKVPARLCGALMDIVPEIDGDGMAKALGVFSLNIDPPGERVRWDSGATEQTAAEFEEQILALMDANPEQSALMGRIYEYSVRLAAIHAVSRAGRTARTTLQDLAWGAAWAVQSARALIEGAANMMAANDYELKFNAIRNAIQTAGKIGRRELLRMVRNVSAREREDIIKHLKDGDWIVDAQIETAGRTALGWRWKG